ncbi:uncharacterized protein DUF4197 [Novosphingobium kunmingense]|uniref:Uncharacterized protein DUF4197 n=1 Tax=Novosphingobium kunmingense TaxID=1211806 RepID=A0A2N0I1J7_9SPHN|nr:DUF4197 domain-containing protein [Novosphingobium kunmingense]PKB25063.1 uncharacterized protein DUF4197 [Novosphingobium kunmingense]
MQTTTRTSIGRRGFLVGAGATGVAALSGCTTFGGFSMTEAIKRLLTLSAQNAFSRLTAPGGFWDSEVARFDLPELFRGGSTLQSLLTSTLFRNQLQRQLNIVAEKGAERAAPLVLDTVRNISIPDAVGLLRGGPTAATSWLRGQMGTALINAMVPGLSDAVRLSGDQTLNRAITALSGIDIGSVAQAVASRADNSIWSQIGVEESAIRSNPQSTNDALLIAALKIL